jgi:hypothetical protein
MILWRNKTFEGNFFFCLFRIIDKIKQLN